ncbi:DUF3160 domain-containing protein [Mobilitalea sibirica]|uniref:DUF3160 domain-containing protein n=1 Tax=Mobilitalea sibirica TaxID=1462919 RepID=A0A8J7HDI5_9FIRM|nr:DUF3160 domain-containing protein [Mobilitalea sibirica]MBH1940819.1 DUF3160 domain-containing protein [Mobilitalea sibirica]
MKKILVVIFCISILLVGCNKDRDVDTENQKPTIAEDETDHNEQPANDEKKDISDTTKDRQDHNDGTDEMNNEQEESEQIKEEPYVMQLNKEWAGKEPILRKMTELIIPPYEAKVKPYTIAKDLSNIENIDQFSGFTNEQINMLVKNGFVVLPSRSTRMHYVYDTNEYKGVPNFITADSVLHTYHQFYSKSLINIESAFLYEDLDLLTKQMLEKSVMLLNELEDEDLQELQKKNIVYFLVARMLIMNTSEISAEVEAELLNTAKDEYALIEKAEGFVKSPLYQFDFDYSQFKVRGHYTRSEELGRYFKTMMWFGTAPLPLMDAEGNMNNDNTLQALLVSFTTFLDSKKTCDAELWANIYLPTAQYVGLSDDINVFVMNELRKEVYGGSEDPNIFNDAEYVDKLYEAVKALPDPKIAADLKSLDTPTEKQFRYMGQRYILDSYVMQTLIDSILRPIPSALDTMGVMGSDVAKDLIFNHYKPQDNWPEYEERFNELKNEISGYTLETWGNNLYNGWLWSIDETLTEYGKTSGMPYFMTTDAWKYKSLNAALGSYTELKHDTVLYGKQSVAEMGGSIEYADYHYVEPNVPLYSKLLYLTDYTIKVLEDRGMMSDAMKNGAMEYKELLELLITCSIKELRNETLTEEEYRSLLWYGGIIEGISLNFLNGITSDYGALDLTDMLVTDISTFPGAYLSLGTGYFDEIYVVIPVEDKLYLSRGAVYSHYEFVSSTRLTDEEWWELQGIRINREEYGDYPEFIEPSEALPKQPFWVENFKADTNEVEITELEVNWDNLSEE